MMTIHKKDVSLYQPPHCILHCNNIRSRCFMAQRVVDLRHKTERECCFSILKWAGISTESSAPGFIRNMVSHFEKYKSKIGVTDQFDHFFILFTKITLIYWCFQMLHVASGPPQLCMHGCVPSTCERQWNTIQCSYIHEALCYGYVLVFCTSVTFLRSLSWRELHIHKMNIKNFACWDAYMNENVPHTRPYIISQPCTLIVLSGASAEFKASF